MLFFIVCCAMSTHATPSNPPLRCHIAVLYTRGLCHTPFQIQYLRRCSGREHAAGQRGRRGRRQRHIQPISVVKFPHKNVLMLLRANFLNFISSPRTMCTYRREWSQHELACYTMNCVPGKRTGSDAGALLGCCC